MNSIKELFLSKKKNLLSIYFTAGFPQINSTCKILDELIKNGVDLVEIGIPFSDPLADGPSIQKSSEIALKNGMNLSFLFEQLIQYRKKSIQKKNQIPLILMGYFNPVLQFGIEKFCEKCNEAGISGTIIPDLPFDEYNKHYWKLFNKSGLKNIFLITPQTSEDRIKEIDKVSEGFIYAVSSASTTGNFLKIKDDTNSYFEKLNSMKLKNPVMVGFGIFNRETFQKACRFANGAIIGTAFINSLRTNKTLKSDIKQFVEKIR